MHRHFGGRRGVSVFAAIAVVAVPLSATSVAAPQTASPSGITITSGPVCTGAAGGQAYPVSVTLPTPYVNENVDVALLLDDTGSFSGEWSSVSSTFSSMVDQLEAAAPKVSFGFGVSMFKDYGGDWTFLDGDDVQTRPFILNQPIVTATTAGSKSKLDGDISNAVGLANQLPGDGGDIPEASLEGLYQLATGAGLDGNGNGSRLDSGKAGALATEETPGDSGDVPPFSSNVDRTSGSLGGIGWRPGALHIAIVATDTSPVAAFPAGAPIPTTIKSANGDSEPSINFAYDSLTPGDSRTGYVSNSTNYDTNTVTGAVAPKGSATVQGTVNALNALGIRVIGMGPGDAPTTAKGPGENSSSIWLSTIARLTGATSSSGSALVFNTSVDSTDLAASIVKNIETSASKPVNVGIGATGAPSGLSLGFAPHTVDKVAPGGTAKFKVTITGNKTSHVNGKFSINFVDAASGAQLGSVPVTVACPTSGRQPVTMTTSLSGAAQTGAKITIPAGQPASDVAVLSGKDAATATGTVTYSVYSDAKCSRLVTAAGTASVTKGKAGRSLGPTLPPGTYYWRASYSGDGGNEPSVSGCGPEVLTVKAPAGKPGTAPYIDTVTTAWSDSTTTAQVSTNVAGDLVVAFVGASGPKNASQTATVSGGGLTWYRISRNNPRGSDAEVWVALPSGKLSRAAVKVTGGIKGYDEVLTVVSFRNAAGVGPESFTSAASGAPKGTLRTPASNAWVFAMGTDWHKYLPRTAGAGQLVISEVNAPGGATVWVQATDTVTATSGTTVTINDTKPTSDPYDLLLVGIQ